MIADESVIRINAQAMVVSARLRAYGEYDKTCDDAAKDALRFIENYVEKTTIDYEVGSKCPRHNRVHNSHGWYICLPNGGIFDETGYHSRGELPVK